MDIPLTHSLITSYLLYIRVWWPIGYKQKESRYSEWHETIKDIDNRQIHYEKKMPMTWIDCHWQADDTVRVLVLFNWIYPILLKVLFVKIDKFSDSLISHERKHNLLTIVSM